MKKNVLALVMLIFVLTSCSERDDVAITVVKAEILSQYMLDITTGRVAILTIGDTRSSAVIIEKNPSEELITFFKGMKPGDKIIIKLHKVTTGFLPPSLVKDKHKSSVIDEIIIVGSGKRYQR